MECCDGHRATHQATCVRLSKGLSSGTSVYVFFYVLQYIILLLWILLHHHLFVENESKLFYKQISPATLPSWKTVSAVDQEASIESETSYIRQDESQTVVERQEVIEGFKFGTTLVPFSGISSFKIIKGCSDVCYYKTDCIRVHYYAICVRKRVTDFNICHNVMVRLYFRV
jgi:hypothetical protein